MKQRGRPRHPDVLTPRQWEVLTLLRDGLSNEQIANRLGISLDGVKFHVSEILGKLGVTSRNEAARWHEERERMAPSASLRHMRRRRDTGSRGQSHGIYRRLRAGTRAARPYQIARPNRRAMPRPRTSLRSTI